MSATTAILIILGIFAFGEIIAFLTKDILPSIFVIMITFLVLFLTNVIPPDICQISGFSTLANFGMYMLLINMGSSVDFASLKREWRTVVCACVGMGFAIIACVAAAPIIGIDSALVAAPIINGGIVATNIMVEAAEANGMTLAAALGVFLYAAQKLVGSLPAARVGTKVAREVVADLREKKAQDPSYTYYKAQAEAKGKKTKVEFCEKHTDIYTTFVCLAIGAVGMALAIQIGTWTDGWAGAPIGCMLIGIALRNLGLVPANFMRDRAKANGFFSFLAFIVIIPSLAKITVDQVLTLGLYGAIIFAVALVVTFIGFYFTPLWKITGSKQLSYGIAMCQMIGFPGTDLIANEVATAVGKTQEERDAIYGKIGVAYVISGFASVTLLSVLIANVLSKLL